MGVSQRSPTPVWGGVAIVEMLGAAIPAFSAMLVRDRLVESFRAQSPPLTLICAAAGYGKTVLAAQIATNGEFDVVIWVPLPDADVSSEVWLRQIADALDCRSGHGESLISEGVRPLDSVASEDSARVRDFFQKLSGHSVLLVIDGANGLAGIGQITDLGLDLMRHTCPRSRVVATCRRLDCDEAPDPSIVWLLEEQDLAFSPHEVRALLPGSDDSNREAETQRVFDYCLGHPAITRILLRHGTPSDDSRPRDLVWQTERIVSGLQEEAIIALYLAAVLGRGGIDSLRRCALACDLRIDWVALSRSVPLFHLLGRSEVATTFRVHAVVSDVLERVVRKTVFRDDCALVRGVAFEELSRTCDYSMLAAALEAHGTEEEVVAFCERDGVSLLRHAGYSSVARLMEGLSPMSVASSPQLLLLRSHIQRVGGSAAAATESALMAKRMAEVNSDKGSLVIAALLLTRLYFDRGMISEARCMLQEVEVSCSDRANVATYCLTQAYLALLDGQAGRLQDASCRVAVLRSLARRLDRGSDEAVFVASSVGAVACQCMGDWRAAASALEPLVRRVDIAHLQQAHIRSNYAAALCELGDTAEALALASGALSACRSLGLESVQPYVASTLSDILWAVGDVELANDSARQAYFAFDAAGDALGSATCGMNAARALRALGRYDESLTLAIAAESALKAQGASVHMIHLMASIEVAASHLALGDVAIAREMAERIASEPVMAEALGHRIRCDLVLAEIDRLSDDSRAAVSRLAAHAGYIATGSANMTLACYIRAFPGLLGLLDEALGRAGLPARVKRLLPPSTVESALTLAAGSLGTEVALSLRERYAVRVLEADSAPVAGVATEDSSATHPLFLRVRAFGKLEVESSYGRVEHGYWCKRKARMLFLMLLCAPAHELPRDVVLERLWPDMDRTAAQRNFYVNWSHMRKALSCLCPGANLDELADANSDACWLTDVLESDLDGFEAELGTMRSARVNGDGAAVVSSAMRLSEIYRGELLPVDLYEEWFEEDRARTKRDFCDAMATGAQCAVEASQYDVAMEFLKRASAIDPWREDIYQLMMQCQMVAGQRSGAIETYNRCRARLVEDLGIDPSAETVRIFQDVLAMEDGACFESSNAG